MQIYSEEKEKTVKSKWIWWGSIFVITTLLTIGYTQESGASDAAAEFSATNNPNGVWRYGWSSATLGSTFNLSVRSFQRDGLDGWGGFQPVGINPSVDGNPSVLHNGTSSTILLAGFIPVPPGALVAHPGPANQKQIVRWIAPAAGSYAVAATFTRTFTNFGSTDVHVQHNGSSIFDGAVNSNTTVSFSATPVSVNAGDTIDYVVGSNGDYNGDSTTLTAVIRPHTTTVIIDIKPGSNPNCFNSNGHGVIPVAILTTDTFDATDVDPFSVTLDGAGVRVKGNSGNASSLKDVDGDGDLDLVVQIEDLDGTYQQGDTIATLKGETVDDTLIEGTDSICIVP